MKLALAGSLALALAACTPAPAPPPRDPHVAQLEARVATLEAAQTRPKAAPGAPDVTQLAQRMDDLETLAREQHQLQQDIQSLIGRLTERAAASPAPLAATLRVDALDPQRRYRIALGDSPAFGAPTAAVTIVAAIQVPERFTHEVWPVLRALRAKYGDDLRVVVQGFIANPPALATTIAACAAARQSAEALDKLEDALWTLRELAQTDASKPWPEADDARTAAGGAGIDLKAYDAALPACAKADRAKGGAAKTYYDRLMKTAQTTK
jgi:protein-disulfide isomerase